MSKLKKVKMPAFHNALTSSDLDFLPSDYLMFHKGHAIITDGYTMIIVNIKMRLDTLSTDHNTGFWYDVIDSLEGKFVTADLWKEFMDADNIEVSGDQMKYVVNKHGVIKTLEYQEPHKEKTKGFIDKISGVFETFLKHPVTASERINLPMSMMKTMLSTFGSEITGDTLLLISKGEDRQSIFTFKVNRHIFGLMLNEQDLNSEAFIDVNMEEYINGGIEKI